MKKTILILVAVASLLTGVAIGQSNTNIVVTTATPPAPATIHQIVIPAGHPEIAVFLSAILPKIDPQSTAITTGQVFKSLTIYPNADGSYGATVIYQ